jgi:mRNA interferase MazF
VVEHQSAIWSRTGWAPPGLPVTGVVLADQVKSLDWQVREAALIKKLPAQIVNEAANLLLTLFGL